MLSRRACLTGTASTLMLAATGAPAATPGSTAPAFDLPVWDVATNAVHPQQRLTLSDLRNRWVYLDFWASWCGPCRQSFPWMNEFGDRMASQAFSIVAVGVDTRAEPMARFIAQHRPRFAVLWDARQTTPAPYQVQAMPSSYLIDPQGRVVWAHRGFSPADAPGIERAVRQKIGLT